MATTQAAAPRGLASGILLSTVSAGVLASIVNVVIGLAARAAGADPTQSGMAIGSEIFLSIVGVLIGAVGWALVRRVMKRPGRVLTVLLPVVFLLSLAPDLGLGISAASGPVWTAVVGLMLMHVMTIAIAVPVYRRFLPLTR